MGVVLIPAAWPGRLTRPGWPSWQLRLPWQRGFVPRVGRMARGVWRAVWRDALAQLVLFAGAAALMYPALADGLILWQDDTKFFYYPLLSTLGAALKAGRLPLWEPGVFGGYPLFADGESGMLYPPHLVLLRLLEPASAVVALRLVRFYLAGAFTYAYLRACGCVRLAAVCGGLTFACSGFMVGQVVHENLASGMVWLPLTLCFVERTVRERGVARYRLAAFAGVALAMQALAVHVQVCVFTALAVFPYFGWRLLFPEGEHRLSRLAHGVAAMTVTGAVGAGLAAAQVLPLVEMATRSARGHGISLEAATINSVSPFRLVTVAFPHLLRRADGLPFGRWVDWEVTVYVGVPVLLLGLCAIFLRRDRYALFFAALAGLSLCLSMGRYGPPWVVAVTEDLLGSHGLRSPGRFAFLWSFGAAALAGFGLDWLSRPRVLGAAATSWRVWLPRIAARAWTVLVVSGLLGTCAALFFLVQEAHRWLLARPAEAATLVEQQYIGFDRVAMPRADAAAIVQGLVKTLDPSSQVMACWVTGVVGGAALLLAWSAVRAAPISWIQQPLLRAALGAASVLVVAGPLVPVALRMHPAVATASIEPHSPAAGFLQSQLAPGNVDPLYRVYTGQAVYLGKSDVEPNILLPLGIQEAGGYSSLSTERFMTYAWAVESTWSRMLDLWNARYFLLPNAPDSLPSHELTSYHPLRPLLSGSGANDGAHAWFQVPPLPAENVRIIATLRDAWGAQPGDVAGWVVAEDDTGTRYEWPLRVALEVAEATAPDPAMRDQRPAELSAVPTYPLPIKSWLEYRAGGEPYEVKLYYAKLPLPENRTIVKIGVHAVPMPAAPMAILRVHGLGLGMPDWTVSNVVWTDREGLKEVFQDSQVRVIQNANVLPRAYLVSLGATLPEALHVKQMAERGFDPERMVLLDEAQIERAVAGGETLPAQWEAVVQGSWFHQPATPLAAEEPLVTALDATGRASASPAGTVHVEAGSGERVGLRVEATAPAWLFLSETYDPAWQATVDGKPARIFLANGMFRAVAVPAGSHRVEMRYAPASLQYGAMLSLTTGVVVLLVCGAGLAHRLTRRPVASKPADTLPEQVAVPGT